MMSKQINIETFQGDFKDAPLSRTEYGFILKTKLSLETLVETRIKLRRELTAKELVILELLERNAILLTDDDFKPFMQSWCGTIEATGFPCINKIKDCQDGKESN